MSVFETVLYFVVPVVGLYVLIWAMVVVPRMSRRPRYRVGQEWPFAPLWWSANPDGANLPAASDGPTASDGAVRGERGGARGRW